MSEGVSVPPERAEVSRRTVLLGVAAAGAAGVVLAGCGGGSSDSADTGGAADTGGGDTGGGGGGDTGGSGGASGLVKAADVPVGGGVVLADAGVVVTQPSKGDFKGFSATCTHMQCTVGEVADQQIVCPCHGSHYSIADGSVKSGPAPRPLPAVDVKVTAGEVARA